MIFFVPGLQPLERPQGHYFQSSGGHQQFSSFFLSCSEWSRNTQGFQDVSIFLCIKFVFNTRKVNAEILLSQSQDTHLH